MEDDRTALMAARALSPGYEILWYTIKKVLGQGGFGITYLAYDRNLDRSVAIKEYLPTPFAYRHRDFSVKPLTGDHRDQFAWGLDSFQREAQTLAKFGHDNIVRVHSVFEKNNTAYMVMEYEDGDNLGSIYQKERGQFNQSFFQQIFFPIFDGLKQIHKFGFIHRDIKPANIYIRENRTPVLIDFGSARQTSRQDTDEMTALVTQGYTPLEQYSPSYGEQGPWTDIYALAATMYEGVVGKRPDESLNRSACLLRSKPDLIQKLSSSDYPEYSQAFLDAVFTGLALQPERRPPDLDRWLAMFYASEKTARTTDTTNQPSRASSSMASTKVVPLHGVKKDELLDTDIDVGVDISDTSKSRESAPKRGRLRAESLTMVLAKANEPAPPAESTRQRAAREFEMGFDQFNFDDDPHERVIIPEVESEWEDEYYEEEDDTVIDRKKWIGIASIWVLLGLLGIGAWFYLDKSNTTVTNASQVPPPPKGLDNATLRGLPVPTTGVPVVLPREIVLQQLDTMHAMASLYKEAYALDPSNPEILEGIDRTYQKLIDIAYRWNTSSYPELANRTLQINNLLPPRGERQTRVSTLLNQSDTRSNLAAIQSRLAIGVIATPADTELLALIGSLSKSDRAKLEESDAWQNMLNSYRQKALANIQSSNFSVAAEVVAAGLTLQPTDTDLLMLREHLQR